MFVKATGFRLHHAALRGGGYGRSAANRAGLPPTRPNDRRVPVLAWVAPASLFAMRQSAGVQYSGKYALFSIQEVARRVFPGTSSGGISRLCAPCRRIRAVPG
jgi:hypothetical protein